MVCSTSGMPPSPLQNDALIHSRAVQAVSSPRMSSRPCSHSLYSITTSNFRTMSRVGRRMCALGPTSFLLPTRKYYFANGTQRRSVPTIVCMRNHSLSRRFPSISVIARRRTSLSSPESRNEIEFFSRMRTGRHRLSRTHQRERLYATPRNPELLGTRFTSSSSPPPPLLY